MALAPVSEAVGEAMVAAFDANAAFAAASVLAAEEAAVSEGLALLGAEIAAEDALIVALETAEAAEFLSGPLGWIAAAFTGVTIAGLLVAMGIETAKQAQLQGKFLDIQKAKASLPKTPLPATPVTPVRPIITPSVIDIASQVPDGLVVQFSDLFDCRYDLPFSRCKRGAYSPYKKYS